MVPNLCPYCVGRRASFQSFLFLRSRAYKKEKAVNARRFCKKNPFLRVFARKKQIFFYDVDMTIRKGTLADLSALMAIFIRARDFMASTGNPHQWGDHAWPPETLIREDIAQGKNYVVEEAGQIVGTFFFDYGVEVEPTYVHMVMGAWVYQGPYGVIHRIASSGKAKGIGSLAIAYASSFVEHLRIDTHEENRVMRNLLKKEGFVCRGTIKVGHDGSPRLAFER